MFLSQIFQILDKFNMIKQPHRMHAMIELSKLSFQKIPKAGNNFCEKFLSNNSP